jgi:F-type H+-transporting ATPase subunit O
LRSALASFSNTGQELNISFVVKPSLIGGMVITIDDKYLDLSMASKIKKMETLLEKSI